MKIIINNIKEKAKRCGIAHSVKFPASHWLKHRNKKIIWKNTVTTAVFKRPPPPPNRSILAYHSLSTHSFTHPFSKQKGKKKDEKPNKIPQIETLSVNSLLYSQSSKSTMCGRSSNSFKIETWKMRKAYGQWQLELHHQDCTQHGGS